MMAENEMKRVNIRVTPEIHEWFRGRSERTGVPMSALMFLALEQYVQQQMMMPHIPDIMKHAAMPNINEEMLKGLKSE